MAYDSARRVVVLFGGNLTTSQGETWEWDGTGWLQHTPVHQPSVKDGHAVAYDSARRVVVLLDAYGGDRGGTWEWDGTDWTQRTPAHRPPSLHDHAMAYDSVRGVVVLFGGSPRYSDTWLYALPVPASRVSISGPNVGQVGTSYVFTATVSPVTTTLPLTYTWEATGQKTISHAGDLVDRVSYSWMTGGRKAITITAGNAAGSVVIAGEIWIEEPPDTLIYLPLVLRGD
jgi:hypothetical protein